MKIVAIHVISPSLWGRTPFFFSLDGRVSPLVEMSLAAAGGFGRLMLASVDRGLGKDGRKDVRASVG